MLMVLIYLKVVIVGASVITSVANEEKENANPEELGDYFEGDIMVTKQWTKNALIGETSKWENAIIPYEIDGFFTTDDINMIRNAIGRYHSYTCLRFRRRRPSDKDYISITNTATGCWSYVGRMGGKQEVNLQSPACLQKIGTALHELLHSVGFHHEQNRWERDSYVSVEWSNIQTGRESNFKKTQQNETSGYGVPYDYSSVMHYSDKAFSANGHPTLLTKSPGVKIGQRDKFSDGDILKVQRMYCQSLNRNETEIEAEIKQDTYGGGGIFDNISNVIKKILTS